MVLQVKGLQKLYTIEHKIKNFKQIMEYKFTNVHYIWQGRSGVLGIRYAGVF